MKKIKIGLLSAAFVITLASCSANETGPVKVKVYNGTKIENLEYDRGYELPFLLYGENNNYVFRGWYTDDKYTNLYEFGQPLNSNLELYAKWVESSQIDKDLMGLINQLIEDTDSYIPAWNMEGFKGRWNYIDGVFLNSIYNLVCTYESYYDTYASKEYKDFFIKYINYYVDSNGQFLDLKNGTTTGFVTTELDTICESRVLFDAYKLTNDERYNKGIDYSYNSLINMDRAGDTKNFSHKNSYLDQIWLDGMYMYGPFYARYASVNNIDSIFKELKEQYEYIRNNMYDEELDLYYHGHDTTKNIFWADKNTGNSKSFWLRSIGWYIMSLVDVLDYYPEGTEKEYLKDLLQEAIEGVLKYQDSKTKMFFQIVDKGYQEFLVPAKYLQYLNNSEYAVNGTYIDKNISNYVESSGSSMIAYVLMKGAKKGYIDEDYLNKGIEVFEGIYNNSFEHVEKSDSYRLNNICITAGLGPNTKPLRDGTAEYYLAEKVGSNDAKGVGPFIMAYIEYQEVK